MEHRVNLSQRGIIRSQPEAMLPQWPLSGSILCADKDMRELCPSWTRPRWDPSLSGENWMVRIQGECREGQRSLIAEDGMDLRSGARSSRLPRPGNVNDVRYEWNPASGTMPRPISRSNTLLRPFAVEWWVDGRTAPILSGGAIYFICG